MKHLLIIIAFCLCIANAVYGQQPFHWQSTNGPGTTAPSVLAVNSNGDIIAGNGNILMRSTDGGVSWLRLPIPRYLGNVKSLVTLPGGKIVLLCSQPAIVRMNADGSSLIALPINNVGRVVSNRIGNLFAYLNSGMIARSRDAGDTWDTIVGPSGEVVYDFTSDEQDYYVGTGTGIYTSTDQGLTWRRCLNDLALAIYYHILAGHNGHVWALAYDGSEGNDFFFSSDYCQHFGPPGSGDWHSLWNDG